jgi:hypothetical protein
MALEATSQCLSLAEYHLGKLNKMKELEEIEDVNLDKIGAAHKIITDTRQALQEMLKKCDECKAEKSTEKPEPKKESIGESQCWHGWHEFLIKKSIEELKGICKNLCLEWQEKPGLGHKGTEVYLPNKDYLLIQDGEYGYHDSHAKGFARKYFDNKEDFMEYIKDKQADEMEPIKEDRDLIGASVLSTGGEEKLVDIQKSRENNEIYLLSDDEVENIKKVHKNTHDPLFFQMNGSYYYASAVKTNKKNVKGILRYNQDERLSKSQALAKVSR